MRMTKARYNACIASNLLNGHLSTADKPMPFWDSLVETGWFEYVNETTKMIVRTPESVKMYTFDGYLMLLRNLGKVEHGRHRVEYIFVTPENRTLFAGTDYSHAFRDAIGKEASLTLLAMLCDNPDESGGTFNHYTSTQKTFGRSEDARNLEGYCEGY